ncbi:MAG TPA: hypothetical protein DIT28_04460 [Oxalobacteraceae bacterium]|nr:hypothetical protein [Oxalobacteraceae bacterium]
MWNAPAIFRGLLGQDLRTLGIPDQHAYVAKYCERTGITIEGDWNFYLAFNLFRLTGINQGVAKRALEGTASSELAQQVGQTTRPLAEMAWSFAQKVIDSAH